MMRRIAVYRLVALLFAVNLFHFIDRSLLLVAIEPIRAELKLSDASISLLAGAAYSLPYAIALIPLGFAVDRYDRIKLLAALLAMFSVATVLFGLTQGFMAMVAFRMLVGIAESGAVPASVSLITSRYLQAQRPFAMSLFFMAGSAGTIISFAIGGYAISRFGWRVPFLAAGIAGLVLALTLAILKSDKRALAPEKRNKSGLVRALRAPLLAPGMVSLLAASALSTALMIGTWAWAGSIFIRSFGFSLTEAGVTLAIGAGVCAGLGTMLAGWLGADALLAYPRLRRSLPILTTMLAALFVIGFSLSSNLASALTAFFAASLFLPMFLPLVFASLSHRVGESLSGLGSSLIQLANNGIGAAAGPMIVGIASGPYGIEFGLRLLAIVTLLVGAPLHLRTYRFDVAI